MNSPPRVMPPTPPGPDSVHAVGFLGVPLPPPLPGGVAVPRQALPVDLLPFLFPTHVLGSFPARHGERHVQRPAGFRAGAAALRREEARPPSPPPQNPPKNEGQEAGGPPKGRTGPCQVFSRSIPALTLSKSGPPQFRTWRRLPSLRSASWKGPLRRGSSKKLRTGFFS